MKSLGEVFQLSVQYLDQKKISRSKFLVAEILSYVLGMDKVMLFMDFDRPLLEEELTKIRSVLSQVARGKPLDYIIGKVDFYGCQFLLTEDTLIPRPETEILVDIVSKEIANRSLIVWDVCTGSGCIGVSLKKQNPNSKFVLSDLSEKALSVAKKNAELNNVVADFLLGDGLTPFSGAKADMIVCNPPYISLAEYQELDPSVRDHEPRLALIGGVHGGEFYEKTEKNLENFLKPGGKVFFEIGYLQGNWMLECFSRPVWKQKKVIKDWSGHDRFFFLEIE
ncbi:MAG: peptide chain release factor N(5)-glutamine methyltransferase [Chlamydiae bacterium]|nr:peptide chain release factor N(5)-glutamine methyltransferase [Chlamydiota bacterium]